MGTFSESSQVCPREAEREGGSAWQVHGRWGGAHRPARCPEPRPRACGSRRWALSLVTATATARHRGISQRACFWGKAWTKGCGDWFCVLGFLHQGAESGPPVGLTPAQRTWALNLSTGAALDPCREMMGEGKPAPPPPLQPTPTPAFLNGGPGVGRGAHFLACSPLASSPERPSFVPCVHVWGLYPNPDVYLGDWWCGWRWAPAVPHHTGNWIRLSRGRRGGRRAPRVLTSREASVPISQGRPSPAVPNLPVRPAGTPPTWPHFGAGRMGWQGSGPPCPQCELHLGGASLSASSHPHHVTSPSRTALRVPTPQQREEACGRRGRPRLLVY